MYSVVEPSAQVKQLAQDLQANENEMGRLERIIMDYQSRFKQPLRERRSVAHHKDPVQELVEVYQQVTETENALSRSLEVSLFMISKNNELLE